ncbi:Hypothetical_protein [Hexamita inflata]|uniref:Hypothetical_protein n=1 Tax=Hexamita inflata TaxID=28002 RepID=A0AA86PHN2_9EUKA|nr:Hypothetical protein HINF_LOCUS27274 [Hexamita inflata]
MYLYIQLTLNKCTTDICCFKANLSEHLVQGECQSCPELYDYDKQQCTTCQLLYGEWSYYLKGDCYCGGGSVGKNTYCDDCWQRRMIVYNNQCVTCASFDKNAYYEYQNRCACVKNLEFNNFKCHWYSSAQQRVIIISTVFSFALLVSIILFIVFKRRKQKQMNQIEFKIKNKRKLTEQNINLIIEDNFKETKVQTKKNVQISTANTTKNELVILDEIENMNQILKEIEIKQIDEIKENDVYLYKE